MIKPHGNSALGAIKAFRLEAYLSKLPNPQRVMQSALEAGHNLHVRGDEQIAAGKFAEALKSFRAALEHAPLSPPLRYNIATTLRELKRFKEALVWFDKAIEVKPDFAMAHHMKAAVLLQLGLFEEGLREYEWRKVAPGWIDDDRYRLPRLWAGEDLNGKTLYIFNELFQGDLLQFCRYAVLANDAGARVVFSAPESMHDILSSMGPSVELIDEHVPPPEFDFQIPMMSLPLMFGTDLRCIPAKQSYLSAAPERVKRWRDKIGLQGVKVGISWQGSARANSRSFPLALASDALHRAADIRLISLQKHAGLDQLQEMPAGLVEDLGPDFDPGPAAFVDTAAALMACDLFITTDTSVAHLAGALGVKTWVALPHLADWRWLEYRSDSPWYPSMRLFRQTTRGDWRSVFAAIGKALRKEFRG